MHTTRGIAHQLGTVGDLEFEVRRLHKCLRVIRLGRGSWSKEGRSEVVYVCFKTFSMEWLSSISNQIYKRRVLHNVEFFKLLSHTQTKTYINICIYIYIYINVVSSESNLILLLWFETNKSDIDWGCVYICVCISVKSDICYGHTIPNVLTIMNSI